MLLKVICLCNPHGICAYVYTCNVKYFANEYIIHVTPVPDVCMSSADCSSPAHCPCTVAGHTAPRSEHI